MVRGSLKNESKELHDPDKIMENVYNYFNLTSEELLENRNKLYRDVAIYLLKKHTNLTNRELGDIFGDISYSAVTKAYQRFKEKMKKDRKLKVSIKEIMANVRG